jgi:beta-glucosidase
MNSVVSQRAMREIYLPAFEISVREGGARSIMSSYNRISGIYSACNYDQNTMILREQWGYTGIVMTDWWAYISKGGEETAEYTLEDHSAMARSQNDVYMVCTTVERSALEEADTFANLTSCNGRINRAELQRNARNILNFALNTPAMSREEGKEITVEHLNSPFAEDDVDPDVGVFFEFKGDEIVIDCQKVMSGRDILFGFTADKAGFYEFSMTASSDLNPLAQIPMTVYYTSIPIAVITWNGTNGEDVTKTSEFMMYSRNSVFRMHLSSGGVTPKQIRIRYLRPFDEE